MEIKQSRTFRGRGGSQELGLLELMEKLPSGITMVELGSAFGESAEVFLSTGKVNKIYCIDPFTDIEREIAFDLRLANDKRVVKIKEKSENVTHLFAEKSIDFVYIDAIHTKEALLRDIKNYKPTVKDGGWIGGHDYSFSFIGVVEAVFINFTFPHFVFRDSSWLVKL